MVENANPEGEAESAAAASVETKPEEGTGSDAPALAIDAEPQDRRAAAMKEAEQAVIEAVENTAKTLENVSRAQN